MTRIKNVAASRLILLAAVLMIALHPALSAEPSPKPSTPIYSLHVADNLKKGAAWSLAKRLVDLGYDPSVEQSDAASDRGYRVTIGYYKSLSDANEAMKKLRARNFDAVLVPVNESRITKDLGNASNPATSENASESEGEKRGLSKSETPQKAAGKGAQREEEQAAKEASKDVGAEPNTKPASIYQADNLALTSLRTIGSCILVLGVIFGLFFLLRRVAPHRFGNTASQKLVRVIESVPLGERRSVVLVGVGGERYLLGTTAQNISLLAKVADQPGSEELTKPVAPQQGFEKILQSKKSDANGNGRPHTTGVRINEITSKLKELSRSMNI